eukprot:TRINITY_DN6432_c0_g1_i1.p1 TRINITY_DN6432_c0_g1~~TRINITY_DN6432_c0_g1_i1.p1  ORF type:complete len:112 (+),score=14.00 TRINITY_DN6432_c0_g1_i1:146-481(+)
MQKVSILFDDLLLLLLLLLPIMLSILAVFSIYAVIKKKKALLKASKTYIYVRYVYSGLFIVSALVCFAGHLSDDPEQAEEMPLEDGVSSLLWGLFSIYVTIVYQNAMRPKK